MGMMTECTYGPVGAVVLGKLAILRAAGASASLIGVMIGVAAASM